MRKWFVRGLAVVMAAGGLSFVTAIEPASGALPITKPDRCGAGMWAAFKTIDGKLYAQFEGHRYAVIMGTPEPDVLIGTSGMDFIHGLGKDDKIWGEGGHDIICGGTGFDELHGGGGRDELYGNEDNDHLFGGSGGDWISGDGGKDNLDYGEASAKLDLSFATARARVGKTTPDYFWEIENVKGTRFADDIDVRDGNRQNPRKPRIWSTVWGGNEHDFLRGDDEDFLNGQGGGTSAGREGNTCFHFPSKSGCTDGTDR